MELKVYNSQGNETGKTIQLSSEVFGIEPNEHAMYLDVKQYLANQRQGTHKSKDKSEVSYSTRKIKRQKGTGGARAGSIKSGVFVGGGRIFGPKPRDYSFKLNKKVKQLARKSALTSKAKENGFIVLDQLSFESPRTKSCLEVLSNLKLTGNKTLILTEDYNKNVYLSARNIHKVQISSARDLNTYQILNAQNVLLTEGAVKVIEDILNR
jgi:large subunit ribosomal protein L4